MNNTFKLGKNHRGIKERANKSIQRYDESQLICPNY